MQVRPVSLASLRWRARLPRLVLGITATVLCLAGLRALAEPRQVPAAPAQRMPVLDLTAVGFAEAFARAYLTWDAERPELHEQAVASFISDALDPGAGLRPPVNGQQRVEWTAAQATTRRGRSLLVTVTVGTNRGIVHLCVPVARDAKRFLSIPAYPAIVGPPAVTRRSPVGSESPIEDQALRAVLTRALENFLERDASNLAADLDRAAVVALPDRALRVRSVRDATWIEPNRLAAVIADVVDAAGAQLTLRYELRVTRDGGRWFVRNVQTNPTS